jgi:uncharacterized protein YeaO (DUF488 family)
MKDVAPTTELRRWFDHRPERWSEFRRRYLNELASNAAVPALAQMAAAGSVTLLYAARDTTRNEAVVLAEYVSTPSEKPAENVHGEDRHRPG